MSVCCTTVHRLLLFWKKVIVLVFIFADKNGEKVPVNIFGHFPHWAGAEWPIFIICRGNMHKMSLLMNKNVLFGAFGRFSGVLTGVLTRFERFWLIGDCIGVRLCDFVQCVCWVGRLRSGGWPILFMGFFTAVCGVLIGCFPAWWLGGCFIVAGMSACGWLGLLRVDTCGCDVECSGWVLVVACLVSAVRLR